MIGLLNGPLSLLRSIPTSAMRISLPYTVMSGHIKLGGACATSSGWMTTTR
jgi:hypothetical protein